MGRKNKYFGHNFNIFQWAKLMIYNDIAELWPIKTYNYQLILKIEILLVII